MTPHVLGELSRPRTPVDRLRTRMTALAAAGTGVALLAALSIAALRSTEPTGLTLGYTDADGRQVVEQHPAAEGGLAPFLAEEGLRPGATLAAVLLVVPFLGLALQALRVGSLALDRQEALLALAGATPGDLRHVRMRRTAVSFGLGGSARGTPVPAAVAAARPCAARGLAAATDPADVAAAGLAGRRRPADAGRGCHRSTQQAAAG